MDCPDRSRWIRRCRWRRASRVSPRDRAGCAATMTSPGGSMRMDRCGQARERPKKHQVDQLFPNDLVSDCRQAKIPTNPNRDTYLAAHAVATLDHERHLAERHILDIIGIHAEAEIGQIEPMVFHHANGPNSIVGL